MVTNPSDTRVISLPSIYFEFRRFIELLIKRLTPSSSAKLTLGRRKVSASGPKCSILCVRIADERTWRTFSNGYHDQENRDKGSLDWICEQYSRPTYLPWLFQCICDTLRLHWPCLMLYLRLALKLRIWLRKMTSERLPWRFD